MKKKLLFAGITLCIAGNSIRAMKCIKQQKQRNIEHEKFIKEIDKQNNGPTLATFNNIKKPAHFKSCAHKPTDKNYILSAIALKGNIKGLNELSLYCRYISEIEPNCFDECNNISCLNLHSNNLRNIPYNLFSKMQRLKTLYLGDNNFDDTFDEKTFALGLPSTVTYVSLKDNYFSTWKKENIRAAFKKTHPQAKITF